MPIVRSDFGGRRKGNFCLFKFAEGNKKQGAYSAEKMDCVCASENIKEAAGLVAGDVHALRDKFAPGNELTNNKQETQSGGGQPEFAKTGSVRKKQPLVRSRRVRAAAASLIRDVNSDTL